MEKGPDPITAIAVQGFKSIRDRQRIEIRPLTILAGANSSGKSSIMQPLLMMKQTLEAPFDPGALLLDGPNVRVTSGEQVLSTTNRGTADRFSILFEQGNSRLELTYAKTESGGFDIAAMAIVYPPWDTFTARPGMGGEELLKAIPADQHKGWTELLRPFVATYTWQRERCFLSLMPSSTTPTGWREVRPELMMIWPWRALMRGLGERTLIHLPGLRGNPERVYRRTAGGPGFPGVFQDYAASVIAQWQSADETKLGQLALDLGELGLTRSIKAKDLDATRIAIFVARTARKGRAASADLVSIADVGFGVSQALPVVVAMLAAEPHQMLYLEQPEIHLHPRAQRKMAHLLVRAAKRGARVVAETHSGLIVREVQMLVAKGEIKPDDVRLHWFKRGDDGMTQVTTAELDENGAYGDWPEDFDEVALASEGDFLDAVERRGARG